MTLKNQQLKYIAYTRKSTIGEDRQMLSLEDQERDLERLERDEHLSVVERYTGKDKGESQSAHKRGRPIFTHIMKQIEAGKANALLVWHPNRLARNAFDGGWIITAMDEGKLVEVKTTNGIYRNTSNDKFMLALEFGMAKKSSDDNGDAVKRGIKSKLDMGWYPSRAPLGYLNTKNFEEKGQNKIFNDPERFDVVKQMWQMMLTGNYTPPQILEIATKDWKFQTRSTKRHTTKNLCRSAIYKIFNNPFYYGPFEYPKGSGNWYQGKHEPLVTKELFDKVQEQLKRDNIQRTSHEFAFTKLMTCGACGSCISAEEKYKPLKDGTTARYIYYGCGRSRDHSCKGNKYVREEELINQLVGLIDKIDINQFGMRVKFEEELKRFNKFQKTVLGLNDPKTKHEDTDPKIYAKYILKEGTNEEKREIMGCFKSKLKITKGIVEIENTA